MNLSEILAQPIKQIEIVEVITDGRRKRVMAQTEMARSDEKNKIDIER